VWDAKVTHRLGVQYLHSLLHHGAAERDVGEGEVNGIVNALLRDGEYVHVAHGRRTALRLGRVGLQKDEGGEVKGGEVKGGGIEAMYKHATTP
jgi:hypothetical protein